MKTFQPACTLPFEPAFVAGTDIRSTLDIVWNCLGVILLCTWSIINLNVPAQTQPRTWRQRLRKTVWLIRRKVRWFLLALVAPEYFLGLALEFWADVRRVVKEIKGLAEEDGMEWTCTHAFFAQMGGFCVKFPDMDIEPEDLPDTLSHYCRVQERFRRMGSMQWKPHAVHCKYMAEVASQIPGPLGQNKAFRLCGNIWVLDTHQLGLARKMGIISRLPQVSEDDISDRSKSDSFVKFLALVQISRLIIDLIARTAQGRPSSQLEIMALAYAGCAAFIYALIWHQPKDVSQPVQVMADRSPTVEEMVDMVLQAPSTDWRARYTMPTESASSALVRDQHWDTAGVMAGVLIFVGIHLMAWNFDFPTDIDKWVWRASSLAAIAAAVLFMGICYLATSSWAGTLSLVASIVLIVVVRLALLVETFRTLYYMEPGGYLETWATNIPSIG